MSLQTNTPDASQKATPSKAVLSARGQKQGIFARIIRWTLGLYLLVVIVADVFIYPVEDFAYKRTLFLADNGQLLLIGTLLLFALMWALAGKYGQTFMRAISEHSHRTDRIVALVTLLLAIIQVIAVHSFVFISGWDSGRLTQDGWNLAHGGGFDIAYYSHYPNNLFMLRLVQICMRVAVVFGATRPIGGVFIFAILNCGMCALALLSIYHVLKEITSLPCAFAGWGLGILLLWTSPWASVMYSDAFMLAAPIVNIRLVLAAKKQVGWRSALLWAAFGACSMFAFRIKPQQVFPLFAVVCLEAVRFAHLLIKNQGKTIKGQVQSSAGAGCAIVLGIVLALACAQGATRDIGRLLDENAQFSWTHYLMMGLNAESGGGYSSEDAAFSRSFDDRATRSHANLVVAQERLLQLGVPGTARLLLDKLLTTYCDGSFTWSLEGHFIREEAHWNSDLLAPVTFALYHPRTESLPEGSLYRIWLTFAQAVWLVILLLSCLGLFLKEQVHKLNQSAIFRSSEKYHYTETLAALTLIMLSGFELIFEARARYLYSFTSLYVLLAAFGVHLLYQVMVTFRDSQTAGHATQKY